MITLPFNMVSNTPVECTLDQTHPDFGNLSLIDQQPVRYMTMKRTFHIWCSMARNRIFSLARNCNLFRAIRSNFRTAIWEGGRKGARNDVSGHCREKLFREFFPFPPFAMQSSFSLSSFPSAQFSFFFTTTYQREFLFSFSGGLGVIFKTQPTFFVFHFSSPSRWDIITFISANSARWISSMTPWSSCPSFSSSPHYPSSA